MCAYTFMRLRLERVRLLFKAGAITDQQAMGYLKRVCNEAFGPSISYVFVNYITQ